MKNRIIGIDIARALAVFIMVLVNFKMVLGIHSEKGTLVDFFSLLQGKGAALFVVLAGVGIAQMLQKERKKPDLIKLKSKQAILYRRALFLFVFGLFFYLLWPADILHYYGFFISVAALMAGRASEGTIWSVVVAVVLIYPLLFLFFDFEEGWDWIRLEYIDFWTIKGFLRNLFFNGFHPVFPWVGFAVAGVWMGRHGVRPSQKRKRIFFASALVFLLSMLISSLSGSSVQVDDLQAGDASFSFFSSGPMPPMPMYMVVGISWSFALIIAFIYLTEKIAVSSLVFAFVKTGQMAFTHYVAHVILGIVPLVILFGENNLDARSVLHLSIGYLVCTTVFSYWWGRKGKRGPMSILMRKITG